jgi:dTMP kinase
MKFIVLEGLDGAGKSTQIRLLSEFLKTKGFPFQYLKFPRMDAPVFGDMIARFLRGEFGPIQSVHPYLVALIYAGDRADAAKQIRQWLKKKVMVIADRYVLSNIAYQCAKLPSKAERERLAKWINELEYKYYKIPMPDISLFLDVPMLFTREKLTNTRTGDDRNYLGGKRDIHEQDLQFQAQVRQVYLDQLQKDPSFVRIDCSSRNQMLPPGEIFDRIRICLEKKNMVE